MSGIPQLEQPNIAGNFLSQYAAAQQRQQQQQVFEQQQQAAQAKAARDQVVEGQQDTVFNQGQHDRAIAMLGPLAMELKPGDQAGFDRFKQAAIKFGGDPNFVNSLTPDHIPQLQQEFVASAPGRAMTSESRQERLANAQIAALNAKAAGGTHAFDKPMMIDVRGPDGQMITTLAQQDKGSGQWVTADEKRTPLGSPEGVTPPGGSGRFQVQAGRVMSAAEDVLRTVKTINAMPITASTGLFGTASAKTSFLGAPLNYLRQTMSNQDIQSYNAMSQGLARSVVTIENQGLAPTDGAIASAAAQLMVQPGDTYLTRIQKQAEFRQHTEAHLTPMLHGNMTTPEQKQYIRKLIADLHEAIPYTVQDIVNYNQKPGTTTFGDYARSTVLRGKPRPQAAAQPAVPANGVTQEYVPGGPPAGGPVTQAPSNVIRYDALGNRIQ